MRKHERCHAVLLRSIAEGSIKMTRAQLFYASVMVSVAASFAVLFAKPVSAQITPISVTDLQPIYDQWCAGLVRHDYTSFREFMAPNLIYANTEGKRKTREQMIANNQADTRTWTKCNTVVRDLWQSGGSTKVVPTNALWGTVYNGSVRVEVASTFIDAWTVVGGKPQNVSSTDLEYVYAVGGKAQISQLSSRIP
jgi:hypothetical protein